MKKFLLASTILCGITGSALAADMVYIEEPVVLAPVGYNWTGGFVGAEFGYLWGNGDFSNAVSNAEVDPDGFLGGVYVGYNYQLDNNIVVGVDADFVWTGADSSNTAYFMGAPVATLNTDLEWEGSLRARLGYAFDRFLPYVAGGMAYGRLSGEAYGPGGAYLGGDSDTSIGWTIGVGLEYAFTDNLIGRAEYRYTDLGSFDGAAQGINSTTDFTSNDIRFGIAYKF